MRSPLRPNCLRIVKRRVGSRRWIRSTRGAASSFPLRKGWRWEGPDSLRLKRKVLYDAARRF